MEIKTINLEQGMPSLEYAKIQLRQSLTAARANRVPILKLIHGYGSSGRGGVIGQETRRILRAMQQQGEVVAVIPGEEFSPFEETTQRMLLRYPELARDRDYLKTNHGITIVVLR